MNSLEAFNEIIKLLVSYQNRLGVSAKHIEENGNYDDLSFRGYPIDKIRNDLKVSEILKTKQDVGKHLWLIEMVSYGEYKECFKENKAGRQEPDISKEEFDLIKGWLKRG